MGPKDVEVLRYERFGSHVELMVEQVPGVVRCSACRARAEVVRGSEQASSREARSVIGRAVKTAVAR